LVKLGSKIQEVNLSRGLVLVGNDDKRVDLKVAVVTSVLARRWCMEATHVNWQST
jgi:hypothetical protein